MEKLAIIGSGISGTPIAYYLQDQYEVDVYEKSSRVGGEQVKAEEQINYLTKASIGYGIEKRVGKRQK
jgi:protoporphyrinogen oxidase